MHKLNSLRRKLSDRLRIMKKSLTKSSRMRRTKKRTLRARTSKTKSKSEKCHSDPKLSYSLLRTSFMILDRTPTNF